MVSFVPWQQKEHQELDLDLSLGQEDYLRSMNPEEVSHRRCICSSVEGSLEEKAGGKFGELRVSLENVQGTVTRRRTLLPRERKIDRKTFDVADDHDRQS
jgi:hypothetical protein